jgi:hypothetical protein
LDNTVILSSNRAVWVEFSLILYSDNFTALVTLANGCITWSTQSVVRKLVFCEEALRKRFGVCEQVLRTIRIWRKEHKQTAENYVMRILVMTVLVAVTSARTTNSNCNSIN